MVDARIALGEEKHVFIDWSLIEPGYGVAWSAQRPTSWETPYGVRLSVHLPRVQWEPMVPKDRPWEAMTNSYATLLDDDGLFRLYYECHPDAGALKGDQAARIAYAESTDGVNWVKPTVGTVTLDGSTDNNLVYGLDLARDRGAHGATVFKDPSAPVDERYKLIHMSRPQGGVPNIFGAVSADGVRWTPLDEPLVPGYFSDTQTVAAFDEHKGRYVGYFRGWTAHEPRAVHGRRTSAYSETDRFDRWPTPRQIVTTDLHDGPDVDIYTNAYTRWPGADAHLMFPAFYLRSRDGLEVHMMTSRDGIGWDKPTRRPVVPSGEPATDALGSVSASCGLAELRPGEVSLPVGPYYRTHNQGHYPGEMEKAVPHNGYLGLATWRRDGFMSLEAEYEGAVTTVPVSFTGGLLRLNAWTRFRGEVRVEVADAAEESMGEEAPTIAGRAFDDCDPVTGDHLEATVSWRGESDLSGLAGRPVRLRLRMRRARLHALWFT